MDLLNKLEEKVILALETIELLNMENDELKEEIAELKKDNVDLSDQKNSWETKVTSLLSQFESSESEAQQQG